MRTAGRRSNVLGLVETTVGGDRVGVPHVVREAGERSVRSIHTKIRTAQVSPDPTALSGLEAVVLRLLGFVRRLVWWLLQWVPRWWTDLAGPVAVTSVQSFAVAHGTIEEAFVALAASSTESSCLAAGEGVTSVGCDQHNCNE
ncbi:hypothetical protein [Haloferax elongans]|nr:hypothetical protein [Haloferax elongans]